MRGDARRPLAPATPEHRDGAPFLPYARQTIEADDIAAVAKALGGESITTGPEVDAFEDALAGAVGARHAVVVSNGTAALHAACFAAGVGPGDEVVVPAVTFLATASCALHLGAEPVFADVDPDTGRVTAEAVAARCSRTTRAVLPVHLAGVPVELGEIHAAAQRAGARVVEDAAHALGARMPAGAVGCCAESELAIFSFHAIKHITTGEGGAITTNDPEIARRLRLFRNHGMEREADRLETPSPGPWYYEQQCLGHNLRMTSFQAALGLSQLTKLERFVARRRALAARYDAALAEIAPVAPVVPAGMADSCAYHLYPVLIPFDELGIPRGRVMEALRRRGIGTQVHYIPLPMQPEYRRRGWRIEDFPGATRYYERTLSLPMFPSMDDAEVDRVVDSLTSVLREGR